MSNLQEIYLIRHGQSTANASGVWQGQMEFPLSEEGRRQARLAGIALAGISPVATYSSPLGRAFETAEIIAREAGSNGEVVAVPGLQERAGGVLEGKTWAERESEDPEFVEKFRSLPEEEQWPFAGAETDEEVLERFSDALSWIGARHPEGGNILVVSHGGAIRAFLRNLFGPDVLSGSDRTPNASITRIQPGTDGHEPKLLELASTWHLGEEEEDLSAGGVVE